MLKVVLPQRNTLTSLELVGNVFLQDFELHLQVILIIFEPRKMSKSVLVLAKVQSVCKAICPKWHPLQIPFHGWFLTSVSSGCSRFDRKNRQKRCWDMEHVTFVQNEIMIGEKYIFLLYDVCLMMYTYLYGIFPF